MSRSPRPRLPRFGTDCTWLPGPSAAVCCPLARDNVLYSRRCVPIHGSIWGILRTWWTSSETCFLASTAGAGTPGYCRVTWFTRFSPVTANFILHLAVHSIAVLSLFSILRVTAGVRAAS